MKIIHILANGKEVEDISTITIPKTLDNFYKTALEISRRKEK